MKATLFSILPFGLIIAVCAAFVYLRYFYKEDISVNGATVFVEKTDDGFQLIRNGKPFYMKGAAGNSNFKELADSGGNTIRLYDTTHLRSNLEQAQKYGLAVIVDIPIPPYSNSNYLDEKENMDLKQKVRDLVNNYKHHPALLMWNLGNEVNYPKIHWKDLIRENHGKKRFIQNFNELLEVIHLEDKNHPVSTSKWNIGLLHYASFRIFSPGIDIVSYNVFGDTKGIDERMHKFYFLFGISPFYISEYGSDGWWMQESENTAWSAPIEQTSAKKAEQINMRYNLISQNENCLGSLLFYWGSKYECTYTWFSMFTDEYKSEILLEIERLWGKTNQTPKFIGLDYMLINKKGASDNLIFKPDELQKSELILDITEYDSITIKWEIYPDVWYHGFNEEKYNTKKMEPPVPLDCNIHVDKNLATFITPDKEGPYRIFAYVYNKNGYFASTNTPFYVLNSK